MFVGHDATNAGDGEKCEHKNFNKDAKRLLLDIGIKIDSDEKKDGSDNHYMGRGKRWFTRAIWTKIQDKEFVKNEISDSHDGERNGDEKKASIDFFEGFASNPLIETETGKNRKRRDGGDKDNIGSFVPLHMFIVT